MNNEQHIVNTRHSEIPSGSINSIGTSFIELSDLEGGKADTAEHFLKVIQIANTKNARHVVLSFRKGTSMERMRELVDLFQARLVENAGINPSRLGMVGVLLVKPIPHVHLSAISDKDRQSGRSIANMPKATIQALADWWERIAGNTMSFGAVWNQEKLITYWNGTQNIKRSKQNFIILPPHNVRLIDRLVKRQERRQGGTIH